MKILFTPKHRYLIIWTIIIIQLTLVGGYLRWHRGKDTPKWTVLGVAANEVIGDGQPLMGSASTSFTLVEFGDYQCPPCASVQPVVEDILARHHARLRLQFRHYPLTQLHLNAKQSAIAAEAARIQGRFWEMHTALYNLKGNVGIKNVNTVAAKIPLNMSQFHRSCQTIALAAVEKDINEANTLKLPGTPSFLLCDKNGRVLQLQSVTDVDKLVR